VIVAGLSTLTLAYGRTQQVNLCAGSLAVRLTGTYQERGEKSQHEKTFQEDTKD
jgi:hypothetical protein